MNTGTLPRMRTLDAAYKMLVADDPDTALSKTALRSMMLAGEIPCVRVGAKRLLNYDLLVAMLQNPSSMPSEPETPLGIIRRVV